MEPEILECPICHYREVYDPPDSALVMYKCHDCGLCIYYPEFKEWYVSLSFILHNADKAKSACPEAFNQIIEMSQKNRN